jgi:hypothetical protein
MGSSESLKDIPDWVVADEACLRMWRGNKAWRRSARRAEPPSSGEGNTLGDTLYAAAQWWHSRERKEAMAPQAEGGRRKAEEGAGSLVRHTWRCPCAGCDYQRQQAIKAGIPEHKRRLGAYRVGHEHPEYREDWRISPQRLADFLATHEADRDRRGRLTHVDMRGRWLNHLDALILRQALSVMATVKPSWTWLITRLVFDRVPQAELAAQLDMSEATMCRRLRDALRYLRDLVTHAGSEQRERAS